MSGENHTTKGAIRTISKDEWIIASPFWLPLVCRLIHAVVDVITLDFNFWVIKLTILCFLIFMVRAVFIIFKRTSKFFTSSAYSIGYLFFSFFLFGFLFYLIYTPIAVVMLLIDIGI